MENKENTQEETSNERAANVGRQAIAGDPFRMNEHGQIVNPEVAAFVAESEKEHRDRAKRLKKEIPGVRRGRSRSTYNRIYKVKGPKYTWDDYDEYINKYMEKYGDEVYGIFDIGSSLPKGVRNRLQHIFNEIQEYEDMDYGDKQVLTKISEDEIKKLRDDGRGDELRNSAGKTREEYVDDEDYLNSEVDREGHAALEKQQATEKFLRRGYEMFGDNFLKEILKQENYSSGVEKELCKALSGDLHTFLKNVEYYAAVDLSSEKAGFEEQFEQIKGASEFLLGKTDKTDFGMTYQGEPITSLEQLVEIAGKIDDDIRNTAERILNEYTNNPHRQEPAKYGLGNETGRYPGVKFYGNPLLPDGSACIKEQIAWEKEHPVYVNIIQGFWRYEIGDCLDEMEYIPKALRCVLSIGVNGGLHVDINKLYITAADKLDPIIDGLHPESREVFLDRYGKGARYDDSLYRRDQHDDAANVMRYDIFPQIWAELPEGVQEAAERTGRLREDWKDSLVRECSNPTSNGSELDSVRKLAKDIDDLPTDDELRTLSPSPNES